MLWLVTYKGSYLSGAAIVSAPDEEAAKIAVERDPRTVCFEDVEVKRILVLENAVQVLYNDNGDY